MIVVDTVNDVRMQRWSDPGMSWGFVPTMGYLHEGHLSLVRRARSENDRVAVSIFVNPMQFAPNEDLATYPQDLNRDISLLEQETVDLVYVPDRKAMYPPGYQTTVTVEQVTKVLEGASRPTHFQGVATIVAKLFNIIQPTRAYFGQKDAQQAVVIRRMVRDLNFNLKLVICPIVREPDGLAMSSRNIRLTADQRKAALVLHHSLLAAQVLIQQGERRANTVRRLMTDILADEPLARVDYVSVANPLTLEEIDTIDNQVLCSLAVFFGNVRLIDNLLIDLSYQGEP